MAKIPNRKVKVQVRVCQIFTFCCNLAEGIMDWQTLTWTFTFFSRDTAVFGRLSHFSLLGGTGSILRFFLGGTSTKIHPVQSSCEDKEKRFICVYFPKLDIKSLRPVHIRTWLSTHSRVWPTPLSQPAAPKGTSQGWHQAPAIQCSAPAIFLIL